MTATQIATGAVVPAVGTGEVSVNGPEDEVLDWWSIDWQQVENDVRRLRQRIFTASRNGDLKKVRSLQSLPEPRHRSTQQSRSRRSGQG